jgi:hypothetical protein
MSFEITGKLIEKFDVFVVNDRFKKREFVLEIVDEGPNGSWTNYAKMQLVQNKTDILDRFKIGDNLKASFNIKGNRWERDGKVNFITSLDCWRLENATAEAGNSGGGGGGYNGGGNEGYNGGGASGGGFNGGGNSGGYNNSNANSGYGGGGASAPSMPSGNSGAADDLPF